jgi:hypothetical protein
VSGAITEATALPLIKAAVGNALRRVSHTFEPSSKWSGWLSRHGTACLLCTQVFSEENILCRALLCFLEDADFGKAFQRAPLLCLDHLQKCLAMVGKRSGFERLLDDQRAKLNGLLNDLIHFEATGKNPESWSTALEWWAGSVGPALSAAGSDVAESETTAAAASEVDFDEVTLSDHDAEKLVFENEKLKRKARDLLDRLNELEGRAASLQYRVATLSEDNKRLELGYTGASTQARGLEKLVRDLTAEIRRLKGGNAGSRGRAAS